jgi:hypothetical protein
MQASSPFFSPFGNLATGHDRWTMWLVSLTLALSLVGYPVASAGAALLDVQNVVFNVPYRAIVVGISLVLIVTALAQGSFRLPLVVGLFMFLYFLRLIADFSVIERSIIERDTLVFVLTVALPALAMGSSWRHYDEYNAALALSGLGAIACILIGLALLGGSATADTVDLDARNQLEALNPITIAYTGAFTAIAAYTGTGYASQSIKMFLLWPVIFLGLLIFLLGGSRGPVIGVSLFFGLQALIRGRGTLATLIFLAVAVTIAAVNFSDLAVFRRFTNLAEDASVLERLLVQRLSFDQAMSSPYFGSAYLELTTLAYPHNLLIEAFMALGMVGAATMLFLQIGMFRNTVTLVRSGYVLLPVLATTGLANAWISGSLFASRDFFMIIIAAGLVATTLRAAANRRRSNEIHGQLQPST